MEKKDSLKVKEKRTGGKFNVPDKVLLIGVPLILVILWQYFATKGILNNKILPAPTKILSTWHDLWTDGKYQDYFLASLKRFLEGFLLGTFFGLVLGVAMGLFRKFNVAMTVLVGFLRSIPIVGWIPIAILSLGVGEMSKIVLVAIGCFWSVFVNTVDGIKGVDPKYMEVAHILEKSKMTQIFKVVLPASIPSILTGVREGFSMAWRSIVAAEMIACASGIGYMITYAREISRPDIMFIGLTSVGILGLILDAVVIRIQDGILSKQRSH